MRDKDHVSCLWPFSFFIFLEMRFFSFSFFLLFDSIRFDFQPRTKILFDINGETNARKIHEIFIPIIRFILHVFCNWL